MITLEVAQKAVRTGCKRARCTYVKAIDVDDDLHIHVRAPEEGSVVQVGCQPDWKDADPDDLSERVRRFAEHYCLGRPYKLHWGDSLT